MAILNAEAACGLFISGDCPKWVRSEFAGLERQAKAVRDQALDRWRNEFGPKGISLVRMRYEIQDPLGLKVRRLRLRPTKRAGIQPLALGGDSDDEGLSIGDLMAMMETAVLPLIGSELPIDSDYGYDVLGDGSIVLNHVAEVHDFVKEFLAAACKATGYALTSKPM